MQHNSTLAVYHCSTNLWKLLYFAMKLSRHCMHWWGFWTTWKEKNEMCLALFNGLIPSIHQYGSIYHVNDVMSNLVYRHAEGRGILNWKNAFHHILCQWYVFHFANIQLHYLDKHNKKKPQACLNSPPPSSVYLDRCWQQSCNECSQTFPLHFAYFKWRTVACMGMGPRCTCICVLTLSICVAMF